MAGSQLDGRDRHSCGTAKVIDLCDGVVYAFLMLEKREQHSHTSDEKYKSYTWELDTVT